MQLKAILRFKILILDDAKSRKYRGTFENIFQKNNESSGKRFVLLQYASPKLDGTK